MDLLRIALGGVLIALGRRIYWLVVAAFGFLLGLRIASSLFSSSPQWLILLLALAAGIIGALVSVTLQRFGIALAGFLAGVYITFSLIESLTMEPGGWTWIFYILGGVAGAVMLSLIFEWTLIILSTIGGSLILLQVFDLSTAWSILAFTGLFILGIALQAGVLKRRKKLPIG